MVVFVIMEQSPSLQVFWMTEPGWADITVTGHLTQGPMKSHPRLVWHPITELVMLESTTRPRQDSTKVRQFYSRSAAPNTTSSIVHCLMETFLM